MTWTADELYELLPAVYRVRDAELGHPLRGLVAVLAEQAEAVDADIATLYDNWFIETAERWVVPYIGDLLRVRTLATSALETEDGLSVLPRPFSQRGYVANSIGYRRRKGTAAVLEQVAVDVTGWRARAVEFFQVVATTQYAKHVRPGALATVDLRHGTILEQLDGPFDRAGHTVEVRAIEPGDAAERRRTFDERGRYNVPNVGLYLWRLQPYRVTGGTARPATPPVGAGYTFNPLGLDVGLFNPPRTEREISHLAAAADLPGRLSRRVLHDELEGRRQATIDGARPPAAEFFRADAAPFAIRYSTAAAPGALIPVDPDRISICDLSVWRRPGPTTTYRPTGGGLASTLPIDVGVDPELGRLAFATGIQPVGVLVDSCAAFSGDLGGGPYDRRDSTRLWHEPDEVTFQVGVTTDAAALAGSTTEAPLVDSLAAAVGAWATHASGRPRPFGLIVLMDSASYVEDLTAAGAGTVEVPAGGRLAIVAADWPAEVSDDDAGAVPVRTTGRLAADKPLRPHLRGSLEVRGTAAGGVVNPGELIVSGLLLEGGLTVLAGNLGRLRIVDTTIVPGGAGLVVEAGSTPATDNGALDIAIDRSIGAAIRLPASVRELHVGETIVDADGGSAISGAAVRLDIQQATVLGSVDVERLEAGNTLFTGIVTAARRQDGCARFCHIPDGSTTPRRFRCQPDLALTGRTDAAEIDRIRAELSPVFSSNRHGDPDYGQLGLIAAAGLRTGAEDGSEMGAFSSLKQPQREANLRLALDEYLRSGLEAGIFFVT